MCEKLPFEVGEQIELEEVLLVGTKDYTCIGRPTIKKARVLATIEEQSQTEKVLIFKKRRRKDSQRHRGYRHWVTMLKIDKIIHDINESDVQNTKEVEILNLKPTASIV